MADPQDPALDEAKIARAIAAVANDFKTNIEDAHWLHQVATHKAADLPTASKGDLSRLMRLLDNHFILFFRNDGDWYDIHPLIRDEVNRIVSLYPRP